MEDEGTIKINTSGIKNSFAKAFDFFAQKKVMNATIIILLLATLVISGWIRTQNISDLKDSTTGDFTLGPDLDPFLYLRHAEEINNGNLENPDMMRYAPLGSVNYALKNLMPWVIFVLFKIMSVFSSKSITYSAIILPVVLFLISIIGFFLFNYSAFSIKFSKKYAARTAFMASY